MPWPPDLKTELGIEDNPLVRCACGRTVNADMMRDVRPLKDQLGIDDDHRCDSCLENFYRTEQLTHEAFCIAHDAPIEIIEKVAAREQAIREAAAQERTAREAEKELRQLNVISNEL
jgi:hypothetical protein